MTHDASGVLVSQQKADDIERETALRLRRLRKLSLILDLDQTVIHATVDPTVGEWLKHSNSDHRYPELNDVHHFTLPDGNPTIYYIKLRPGTFEFLEKAFKLFEMHVYTMGTRHYANAVAKILDPTGKLFGARILSRDESGSFHEKSIKRLFPGEGEKMVVAVDDRGDVWGWSRNLIRIKPYDFFVGIGDINEPGGKVPTQNMGTIPSPPAPAEPNSTSVSAESSASSSCDTLEPVASAFASPSPDIAAASSTEPLDLISTSAKPPSKPEAAPRPIMHDTDRELYPILDRLTRLHAAYYAAPDPTCGDVRVLLDAMRTNVLADCVLVLSGIVPVGMDPERHETVRLSRMFGAQVARDVDDETTHVVAAKLGTDKVHRALRAGGVAVVSPEWLFHSVASWRRLPEQMYLLHQPRSRTSTANSSTELPGTEGVERPPAPMMKLDATVLMDMDAEIDGLMDSDDDEGQQVEASGEGDGESESEVDLDLEDLLAQEIEGALAEGSQSESENG
ncbi:HAD-like domain-containing protein [Chytriomyces sp. MP71]|nr:HAD-like domain-containing protein [Chytriomyces sp. MP71]